MRTKRVAIRTVVAFAALIGVALAFSASAWAGPPGLWERTTAEITLADASPDWSHGSIAGSVTKVPPPTHHVSYAAAYVVAHDAVCLDSRWSPPNAKLVWESPHGVLLWDENPRFDVQNLTLNIGPSPRICLYGVYWHVFTWPWTFEHTLLASRVFTVPPPPPPVQQKPEVTLSRGTAVSKAKAALNKRFGAAYKRGKRKRLRCSKRSSTRYLCRFSFRYEEKRRHGTVTVTAKQNGSVTTKVRRL